VLLLDWTTLIWGALLCAIFVGTPKAFQTSAQPGMTRALSTRLKLSVDPPVYAYDTPGVMLPFMGHGTAGAERGVKLALIGACIFTNLLYNLGLSLLWFIGATLSPDS
jgi:hypothetical protein